jgi:hypothetical protein
VAVVLKLIFSGLLLLGASNAWCEGVDLREGLWHIDFEMTGQGKGPQSGPIFVERCISANNIIELVLPPNSPCKGGITASTRRRINWHMICKAGNLETQVDGIYEFSGEKLVGAILSRTPQYSMELKTKLEGRYIGPCSDAQKPLGSSKKPGASSPPPPPNSTPGLKPYGK